jgi:hypothetical protein
VLQFEGTNSPTLWVRCGSDAECGKLRLNQLLQPMLRDDLMTLRDLLGIRFIRELSGGLASRSKWPITGRALIEVAADHR